MSSSATSSQTKPEEEVEEGDLKVITYRDHHHAYPTDTPGLTLINRAREMTRSRRLLQFTFLFIMIHYLWWIIPMLSILYGFVKMGAWPISAILLAIYIPTFINGDQLKRGRPWSEFRRSRLWWLTSRYIGVEVVRTKKLDANKKYMFGVYPHGILILSRVAMYGGVWESLFPGIETRVLAASPMFYLPGSREICLWMGAVDAAKKVAMNVMNKFGLNLMVYPGGSDEIFLTDPNSSATTLVVRKGFIKLSVQSGATIVPAFVFGEKWLYHRRTISERVRRFFMIYFRTPLIVFWGRYFTWLPYHDREKAFLSVVFGSPIDVIQQSEPSEEYINELWEAYITQIRTIYDEYKIRFGYDENEYLVIQDAVSERQQAKKKQ